MANQWVWAKVSVFIASMPSVPGLGKPNQELYISVFHALTGCDTVSAFKGKGKKSAWQAWQAYEEVTDTFVYLANHPFEHLYAQKIWHFYPLRNYQVAKPPDYGATC